MTDVFFTCLLSVCHVPAKAQPPRAAPKAALPGAAAANTQRYFRIPFVRPSDQHRGDNQQKGWWVDDLFYSECIPKL